MHVPQRREELHPGHKPGSRNPALVLARMNVAQLRPGRQHRLAEVLFFADHVEGVQMHLHILQPHFVNELHRIPRSIDKVRFKPVHRLNADNQLGS